MTTRTQHVYRCVLRVSENQSQGFLTTYRDRLLVFHHGDTVIGWTLLSDWAVTSRPGAEKPGRLRATCYVTGHVTLQITAHRAVGGLETVAAVGHVTPARRRGTGWVLGVQCGGIRWPPVSSHTLIFYDKSTGTVHGCLVRGLLLQAHLLWNSVPGCIKTRHFYSVNWKIFWGGDPQRQRETPYRTHLTTPLALKPCPPPFPKS